jgi:D-alanine-D-alanine ligase
MDEGYDAQNSAELIRRAAAKAKRVLVLRPGNVDDKIITKRRGGRTYRFRAEGEAIPIGRRTKKPELLRWTWNKLEECANLTSPNERISLSTTNLRTETLPLHLPHRVTATLVLTYPDQATADRMDSELRTILGRKGPRWELELYSDRPPMPERRATLRLVKQFGDVAAEWDIPLKRESSTWPSVAGLVPAKTACLCGIGPVARNLRTPSEAVQRISLVQRTLLLAQFLARQLET